MMTRPIQVLLRELKSGLTALYGDRLKGVYLYGSYARDEADAESDVDVLVVLEKMGRYADEIDRTSLLVSSLSLHHGLSVSRVFIPQDRWNVLDTTFLQNAHDEAIPA